jgi:hypothetical protein
LNVLIGKSFCVLRVWLMTFYSYLWGYRVMIGVGYSVFILWLY